MLNDMIDATDGILFNKLNVGVTSKVDKQGDRASYTTRRSTRQGVKRNDYKRDGIRLRSSEVVSPSSASLSTGNSET